MSLDKGTTALRICRTRVHDSVSQVPGFSNNSLPPFEYIKDDPIFGWTTGRHLLDREINVDSIQFGGNMLVHLVKAWKAVPSSRLKAEVRAAVQRRMAETGQPCLSRTERTEIVDSTRKMLLPGMPAQLKGTMLLHVLGTSWVFTDAVAEAAMDELAIHYRHAQATNLEPLTPESLAAYIGNKEALHVPSASFSINVEDKVVSQDIGHDFLTWLWFMAELHPEELRSEQHNAIGVLVEGPLTFVMEGSGAHQTKLTKGNPPVSSEARACLQAGKKLASCTLALCLGDRVWRGRFTGADFTTRGLKLPEAEDVDAVSAFQDRVQAFRTYTDLIVELFTLFLQHRRSATSWGAVVRRMRSWVMERNAVY